MEQIECEVRSFVTEDQYEELLKKFKAEAEFLGEDNQTTYYFDCKEDLRIQLNDNYSKIWLKEGALHDEHRVEIEIRAEREDFEKMEKLFIALGYNVEIKWFRKRNSFKYKDINIALDHTKGYGHIIELEKLIEDKEKQSDTIDSLKLKLKTFGVDLTSKEIFDAEYDYYKNHWRELVEE